MRWPISRVSRCKDIFFVSITGASITGAWFFVSQGIAALLFSFLFYVIRHTLKNSNPNK